MYLSLYIDTYIFHVHVTCFSCYIFLLFLLHILKHTYNKVFAVVFEHKYFPYSLEIRDLLFSFFQIDHDNSCVEAHKRQPLNGCE